MGLSVSRADLENASSTARSGLDNISSRSASASNQIGSFIEDSKLVLKGTGFDYVRARLEMYQTAINKLMSICEALANNIIAANNMMINATQGLDLNTDNIEELEQRVHQIESLINWYSESIVVDESVPEEERKYMVRNQSMANYYSEVLRIIKEKLELLQNLEKISNEAAAVLDNVSSDITSYSSNVSSIIPANI